MECKVCNAQIPTRQVKKKIKCSGCGAEYIDTNHGYIYIGLLFLVVLPLKVVIASSGWAFFFTGLAVIIGIVWASFQLFSKYELSEMPANKSLGEGINIPDKTNTHL
ncbi:hypothetical protein [Sedimenticola hydrogenitrophicus]|uniref:hypothetical protein n=1 Tax=Sedimenticola hydrogenitrophicus TaxID=2967975 RepID=UPI0021A33A9B|nr:hypothetical protein [Sedimenticola hydrogenitrophicus]